MNDELRFWVKVGMSAGAPAKYASRPVEIEAVQWTGDNVAAVKAFVGLAPSAFGPPYPDAFNLKNPALRIKRPGLAELWVSQAWCEVEPGTWVIAESDGSGFYPCAADVFAARWEER